YFLFGEKKIKYIGLKNTLTYLIFQRIFRINSHVPWPVHWSSIVAYPEKIEMRFWRPYPGYMTGNYIQTKNGIIIGKNVRIGPGVKIISASHDIYDYDKHTVNGKIVLEDNVWLAANVVILPGVEIGPHTVVAAGAVVNKSFKEENCVLGCVGAGDRKRTRLNSSH